MIIYHRTMLRFLMLEGNRTAMLMLGLIG